MNGKEPEGGAAGSCVDWKVTLPFGKSTAFSYFLNEGFVLYESQPVKKASRELVFLI